jgi:molybdenum cofactor cytidylyltransferase
VGNFAAVIPAAGFSSRMGLFKPLLPFGSSLVIEKTIDSFKQAGITDIRVVVGHKRKLLQPVLDRLSVKTFINHNYVNGMYSSIQTGVMTIDDSTDAFFILPGDCLFVHPETIIELQNAYIKNPALIVYPVYNGHRGHPVLISAKLRSLILNSDIAGGLRAVLEKESNFSEIEIQDPGIISDMDTISDYQAFACNMTASFPSEKECLEILHSLKVPEKVLHHSKEVSRIAVAISENLNSKGFRINTGLVMSAGLLHDIARDQPDHAQKGAEIISGLGYKKIADIIAQHMDISQDSTEKLNETSIIYLVDKMLKENVVLSLDKRLADSIAKFGNDKNAVKNITERFNNAFIIKNKIENILGITIEDILKD